MCILTLYIYILLFSVENNINNISIKKTFLMFVLWGMFLIIIFVIVANSFIHTFNDK